LEETGSDKSDRGYRNALINHRDAVFFAYLVTGSHEISGIVDYSRVYFFTGLLDIAPTAIEQTDAHCDCSHIKIFLLDHLDRGKDLVGT
jgi:hypothetical protein